jgi:hypothetical protein
VTRGFLPVLPRNSGFTAAADRATIAQRPAHSHSIVSSTHNPLKTLGLSQHHFNFTVRLTVKIFCLVPIEPDRCRMLLRA